MRKTAVILFFILLLFSCTKSEEQKSKDKEKVLKFVQEADKLFYENYFTKALELYLKAENIDAGNPAVCFRIGFCYDKGVKDQARAEKYYLKIVEKMAKTSDPNTLASSYFHLGYIASQKGDAVKKFEYFNSAFSIFEKLLENNGMRGEDYFRLGYYYYDKNDFKNARKYFTSAIDIFKKENPGHIYHAMANYNIGVTYLKEGDCNTAIWYYKLAMKLEPDNELYKIWYKKALQLKETSGI